MVTCRLTGIEGFSYYVVGSVGEIYGDIENFLFGSGLTSKDLIDFGGQCGEGMGLPTELLGTPGTFRSVMALDWVPVVMTLAAAAIWAMPCVCCWEPGSNGLHAIIEAFGR